MTVTNSTTVAIHEIAPDQTALNKSQLNVSSADRPSGFAPGGLEFGVHSYKMLLKMKRILEWQHHIDRAIRGCAIAFLTQPAVVRKNDEVSVDRK